MYIFDQLRVEEIDVFFAFKGDKIEVVNFYFENAMRIKRKCEFDGWHVALQYCQKL